MTDHSALAPEPILNKARKRALRPGEVEALGLYISGLERQARSAREATAAASVGEHVFVALSHDGAALLITLPGAPPHSIRVPLADPHLGWKFLIQTLRNRRGEDPNPIGTPGAPTQANLAALAKASSKPPKRVGEVLSLEDLGL